MYLLKTASKQMRGIRAGRGSLYPRFEVSRRTTRNRRRGGQRHRRYLEEHKRAVYTTLLTSGKLNGYLADIDQQAQDMFLRLVDQMAEREGVTEQLKAEDQMRWVGLMNNIADRAREVVNTEIIYC